MGCWCAIFRGRCSIWWSCSVTFCRKCSIWWCCSDDKVQLCVAGAVFGEVGVSLFVARAIFGEFAMILERKILCQGQYLVKLRWCWSVSFCGMATPPARCSVTKKATCVHSVQHKPIVSCYEPCFRCAMQSQFLCWCANRVLLWATFCPRAQKWCNTSQSSTQHWNTTSHHQKTTTRRNSWRLVHTKNSVWASHWLL